MSDAKKPTSNELDDHYAFCQHWIEEEKTNKENEKLRLSITELMITNEKLIAENEELRSQVNHYENMQTFPNE